VKSGMSVPPTRELSGGAVLQSIRADLAPYRESIAPMK
jgi:hypothetical protein